MKDMFILAIESSCDETSCAIVKNGCEDIATVIMTQIDIHTKYGGVVPEIASREHLRCITLVIEECLTKAKMTMDDIDAIAVTYGPGLIGSLLVGVEAAKTLALVYNKPLIKVNHMAGHIYANNLTKKMEYPLIALVISGGHTDLIYMKDEYSFEKIGGTLDDAIGECYDKVARVIGVGYPGGPVIDNLSTIGTHEYNLPVPLNDDSYNFSFSGLKSAVINLAHNLEQKNIELNKENLAKSFQDVVVDAISKKTMKALHDYKVDRLIVAGGVSANKEIRETLRKLCAQDNIDFSVPDFKYCTDNATMIGAAGYFAFKHGDIADESLNAAPGLNLV